MGIRDWKMVAERAEQAKAQDMVIMVCPDCNGVLAESKNGEIFVSFVRQYRYNKASCLCLHCRKLIPEFYGFLGVSVDEKPSELLESHTVTIGTEKVFSPDNSEEAKAKVKSSLIHAFKDKIREMRKAKEFDAADRLEQALGF
jgi:hypothetical protein